MEYFTIENLVWAMFLAILAAIVYSWLMQKSLSELAEKLILKKADSEENALTLQALGYKKGLYAFLTEFFAKNGNYISKAIVKLGGEKTESGDSELLFSVKTPVKYYIPEENNDKRLAKHIKDRMSFAKLVAVIVMLVIIALAASTVIDLLGRYASTLTENGGGNAIGITEDDPTLLEEQAEANREEELAKKKEEELKKIEEQARKELEEAMNAESEQPAGGTEAEASSGMPADTSDNAG
ncbi:MAG: hypothetical protein IJZ20_03220 [Clostridia bacterium]|nr:hypothetical protein [Clostridia bacterium]